MLTGGAKPEDLNEVSEWQNEPDFLKQPIKEWPKKYAKEVATNAKKSIDKLQRKAFSAVLTRAQAQQITVGNKQSGGKSNPQTSRWVCCKTTC